MIVIGQGVVDWVAARVNAVGGSFGSSVGIGLLNSKNEIIAGVVYCDWNGRNIVCHIASDGSKRWMKREYLKAIFDYPFNQLKARRITVCVGQGNEDSRKFVEKLGFTFEAPLKDAHPSGDILIFRMYREQCRFLEKCHEKLAA